MRLENHELAKKLRRLESASSYASAFELYEQELEQLKAKLDASRSDASELEATCREVTADGH